MAAAEAAVAAVCSVAGYAGLAGLVTANLDYIVEGVCRRLRHLDNHPR